VIDRLCRQCCNALMAQLDLTLFSELLFRGWLRHVC